MTVRDIDRGARRFTAALEKLARGPRVTVGVHEDDGAQEHRGPSSATVAQVAAATEYSTAGGAGARSWLRSTIDNEEQAIERELGAASRRALKASRRSVGDHVERELGAVAAGVAEKMQARIRDLGLVESGHLLESVGARVNGKRVEGGDQ